MDDRDKPLTLDRSRAPRRILHRVAVGVGTLCCASFAAAQDTGIGIDTAFESRKSVLGGTLGMYGCDERGISWLRPHSRRTPTGVLYPCAPAEPELRESGDWSYSATWSLGVLAGGDDDNAQWQRFTGWDDGLSLDFDLRMLRREDGTYGSFRGSRLSSDNQFFKLTEGRAGHYRIEAFYRAQPNVVSGNARSLWQGVGTNHLTLPEMLTPAASTPDEVSTVLAATRERRLEVQRDKLGIGFTYYFDPRWTAFFSGTHEEREGSRPFGGAFFFNFPFPDNGGIFEIPRVIDDGTTNLNGGARFVGTDWRMEFTYAGSFYRSRYNSFDYETPYAVTPVVPGAVTPPLTRGLFATEPDNDYHNVRANFTRRTVWNGELSLTGSRGEMKQNEPLLPPIDCEGQFGIDLSPTGAPVNPFLFDCADWNTPASLSRRNADLKIATSMLAARLVLRPTRSLTLRGDLRWDSQDYRGDYIAFNPLTGQYGYVAENGAQGSVVPDEIGFWDPVLSPYVKTRIRNLPLDRDVLEASVGADWRLSSRNTFGVTYTFKNTDREHREVGDVEDNSLRLTWANRRFDLVTLRANYTYLRRSGDPYDFNPYEFTFSTSLPEFVPPEGGVGAHTVENLRKYDVARRDQQKLDVMATYIAGADMTLSGSIRAERNDYDAELGREGYDTLGATVQWEWQPTQQTIATVYVGYDRSALDVANVNDTAITPDPALGGATYPLEARWWVEDVQRNGYFGATYSRQLDRLRFELGANHIDSRGTTDFAFASAAALQYPDALPFPTMDHRITSLSANVYIPVTPKFTLRVFDYYERGRLSDWHYLGFSDQRVYDHRVYTDGGPEDYRDNVVGVMFEARL